MSVLAKNAITRKPKLIKQRIPGMRGFIGDGEIDIVCRHRRQARSGGCQPYQGHRVSETGLTAANSDN